MVALQLAKKNSDFLSALLPHLLTNTEMVYASLENQADKLIAKPLGSADTKTVIIIDALDNFDDKFLGVFLLELGEVIARVKKVKFLIASRPHPWIEDYFRGKATTKIISLHDIAPSQIREDIKDFFVLELSKLHYLDQPDWPTQKQLGLLCDRAANLFAFAAATVQCFGDTTRFPDEYYQVVEGSPDDTTREGEVTVGNWGLRLDSLCASTLRTSFPSCDSVENSRIRSVLNTAISSTPPPSIPTICRMVHLEEKQVVRIIQRVYPLLELYGDADHFVLLFHKLLADYLRDPARCLDKRFHCPKSITNDPLELS